MVSQINIIKCDTSRVHLLVVANKYYVREFVFSYLKNRT